MGWSLARAALTVAACLLVAVPAPVSARSAWAPPVGGEVVERFDFAPGAPYAGGQHRGVDLAARPGQLVGAPCAGRVTYAGRVPGHGRGVTLACDAYAATVLDLARTRVARGARTTPGAPVGTAAG
ncbi:MAG TPA: peptidoglycan DD-metalloendopeptidase family protein, partial [Solirubrobacteraceae bacterium]|nr:peptidoglycan DD-metalloendopeptidase family protein [Solirubrobacteraceae bacterium]